MSKLISSTSRQIPLYFLFISLLFQVNSQSQTHDQEQRILLNLKTEWKNPPSLNTWNASILPHCIWTGIICDVIDGFVTRIELINMGITEKIPPFICDLKNLTEIDLSENEIPGEFPTSLYNCSNLELLDLSNNHFVGRVPDDINRLSNLRVLNLIGNNYSGSIPASVGEFQFLEKLQLSGNLFDGYFPPEIGNLTNLEVLQLGLINFSPSKIPSEFGKLTKLKELYMTQANLIGEIPETLIDSWPNLELLNLASNNLSGNIPRNLFRLKNLTYVNLYQNQLSGKIPSDIESLKVDGIDLSFNRLTGPIPEGVGKWQYLRDFDMYSNRLTGEIPASIGRIPWLINIRLFRNNLTGVLPPELGLYSKLETLEVSENQLIGKLPESLCAGGQLTGIAAFSNRLSGELPRTFEKCIHLTAIMLEKNKFSGEISAGVWSFRNLSYVRIYNNSFSGELPDKFGPNLMRLEMDNNRFSGSIPAGIVVSTNLVVFKAINNRFSGKIPVELTALSRLDTLALDGNQLSGEFPSKIISWTSLVTLTLSRNQISGELPPAIGSLPKLNVLELSENQISGEIPSEFGSLKLSFLNLSSNRLSGKVPSQLDNMGFENSFLNNYCLCANTQISNLLYCNSSPRCRSSTKLSPKLLALILVIAGTTFLASILLILFAVRGFRKRKHAQDIATWKLTSFQRLDFTEANILSNLTENNIIGSSGSGKVYKVPINHSRSSVAVKKIWSKGKLDQKLEKEFQAEVQILGNFRHYNIVKLLCSISSKNSKLLVYEYMENGSLDQWLHEKYRRGLPDSNGRRFLDWPKRLQIAIGIAQGLSYMHHNCDPPIIHRDIKSSNILLDADFKARIADFGLATMLNNQGEHISASVVAGSFRYIAPEYGHTTKINEKIDVFSFGVVLLELVTGREANKGDEHTALAEWAWRCFQEVNSVDVLMDEEVKEESYLEEMRVVFRLGMICTGTLPSSRPTMMEALQILVRHAPLQQEYKEKKNNTLSSPEYDAAPLLVSEPTNHLSTSKGSSRDRRTMDVDDNDCDIWANLV